MITLSRPLPLELHEEIHKCLPLPNAIHVLVNISSQAFVGINSDRMRRNIQRIKTSLNEYIGTLVGEERKNDREKLIIYKEIEWKPELDALFRHGSWLTSTREFNMIWGCKIVGIPENFVEKLFLYLLNSCSTQMTLRYVGINFERELHPIPTCLEQLLNKKEQNRIGDRILFDSIQLEMGNGQILQIFDGELKQCQFSGNYTLRLILMNKMDGKNWFQILIDMDSSQKFIERFEFSKWNMQSFDDIANFIKERRWYDYEPIKENDNKLEAKDDINWNGNLDVFLRRGIAFSQFRHFSMKKYGLWLHTKYYLDFLISYISNAKNPQDLLESIDINLKDHCSFTSLLIDRISVVGKEGGKSINLDNTKLHILSAKIVESKKKFEFTLVNIPTNGTYLFDFVVQFGYQGLYKIVGIKIQKRKNDEIVDLKCENQIEKGKKRKATNNDEDGEDGPTCSAKLMKQ